MKISLLLCIILFAIVSVACIAEPVVYVPYVRVPVALDGKMTNEEWSDAAVLRSIHTYGNAKLANPPTEVYLKYDSRDLWVAARCFEAEKGYPKACKRSPADLLTNDDSIQVVLGISDAAFQPQAEAAFGGYAGATAQKACAADYYYQFTANSVGSVSRFFIESALDRPLFKAKAGAARGCWTVEMRIPFASWGANEPAGRAYPANFFRFRPPDMTAWHLPAFGGYAPMPFGEIVFLPKDQSGRRTVEPEPFVSSTSNEVRFANGMPLESSGVREPTASLDFYPLAGQVIGRVQVPAGSGAATAVISIAGQEVARQDMVGQYSAKVFALVTDEFPLPARATLDVISKEGEKLLSRSVDLEAHKLPEWYATDAGKDYLNGKVPKPWSRVLTAQTCCRASRIRSRNDGGGYLFLSGSFRTHRLSLPHSAGNATGAGRK